ncbi:MAG: hypothetical protein HXX16_05815 [Bacteroidales bacterium]|nr:hypothetical protein [Bacteroidales bacterium]
MNTKKVIINLIWLSHFLILTRCKVDDIKPIDIFAKEQLTSPTELPTNSLNGANKLYVNSDRIIQTPDGYNIKGTIFSESSYGIIPVTSGDFMIKNPSGDGMVKSSKNGISAISNSSTSLDFHGYGTAEFPATGLLQQFTTNKVSGSTAYYKTGKILKTESDFSNLPLVDSIYYFHYIIDQSTERNSKGKDQKIKNTTFTFKDFFLDARDPAVFFLGDIKSKGKDLVKNLGIGISAGGKIPFNPLTYSNTLEQAVGGTGFTPFLGHLFFGGEIPIRKYPLKVVGRAVINTGFSSAGVTDFFDRGFDESSFQMGANGYVTFDKSLISFLPLNLDVKLAKATLQAEYTDNNATIRFAGEYSNFDYLREILGEDILRFIPVTASEGKMYASIGTQLSDYKLYIESALSINIPGLGLQPINDVVIFISPAGIQLSGKISMPYEIGSVEIHGIINSDGTFKLTGTTHSGIRFNSDLRYDANISVELSNNGVILSGNLSLPYGIGDAQFVGEITDRGIGLTGSFDSRIRFSPDVSVQAALSFTANSWEGIKLQGNLNMPAGIANVGVYGEITLRGLALGGTFSSNIDFGSGVQIPAVNMAVDASTWGGVNMRGSLNLPYGLGGVAVSGGLTSDIDLYLGGKLGSNLSIVGVSIFNCDLSLSASIARGVKLNGSVKMPGGIGDVGMGGGITSSGFNLYGEKTINIDFVIISLNTGFQIGITQSAVNISAYGEGCVGIPVPYPPWTYDLCETVGVSVEPDWGNGSFELCMDFPVIGSQCIRF